MMIRSSESIVRRGRVIFCKWVVGSGKGMKLPNPRSAGVGLWIPTLAPEQRRKDGARRVCAKMESQVSESRPWGTHNWTHIAPTYSSRVATLVPQPVTITFSLGSRISSATVSVYRFASLLTTITRVSLCVDVQAPAELKIKASDTAL